MALEKKPFLRLLSLQFKFHSTRLHEAPPSCLHCTDGFGRIKVPRLPAGSSTLLLGRCLPQSRRACLGCCPWVGEVFLRRVGLGLAAEQAALPCSRKVSWGCARVCVWLLQGSRYLPWSRFSALGLANQTELPRTPDGASRRRIAVTGRRDCPPASGTPLVCRLAERGEPLPGRGRRVGPLLSSWLAGLCYVPS